MSNPNPTTIPSQSPTPSHPHERPPTPQPLLHRLPPKPTTTSPSSSSHKTKPKKYIILLLAPTAIAGKLQIATTLARELAAPLFVGDGVGESCARAAGVGAGGDGDGRGGRGEGGDVGERSRKRYQRMWMNKMTRTGLLFPEASRAAGEFVETPSSAAISRRGSASSISSISSSGRESSPSSSFSNKEFGARFPRFGPGKSGFVNRPVLEISDTERRRKDNPALMVLTHPAVERWCRDVIRGAVGEYGIGVVFVPLFKSEDEEKELPGGKNEEELPVLIPLDRSVVSGFTSFDALRAAVEQREEGEGGLRYGKGKKGRLGEEMVLEVDVGGSVEEITQEVLDGVRDIMFD
ncbi:hypothetical protein K402DRAFT_388774 [Aulographum hederae CBS 113979]|uniref:Uncharacterized protein n=1 Tax=Aulographum hederae CBS 113979 TaxID=1176131 RepID=A0A6G1HEB3_9PEZI|nr:hypothetical protein K402DRAFT_388774 [Aulographum hederae CBS 113979]